MPQSASRKSEAALDAAPGAFHIRAMTGNGEEKRGKAPPESDREARLAEALRANLRRRKAAARKPDHGPEDPQGSGAKTG